ncbi:MAG: hypothetical protein HKN46_02525 [Acidimicrobiia bacterium]|nr:hypothetical protein [Acidimicrobiia bacterium]
MQRFALVLVLLLSVALAGCNRESDTDVTTTVPAASTTTEAGAEESTTTTEADEPVVDESTPTTVAPPSVIELAYQVRFKGVTDGRNVVVLQIEEGTATDVALETLAREALDEFEPLAELHVVDAEEAVELVRLDPASLTDEERSVLDQHHLLSVRDAVLTYEGPFADLGEFVLGS